MTNYEAIEKAKQELSLSRYLAEISRNAGLRSIHERRCSWLSKVVALAERTLKQDEAAATSFGSGKFDPLTIDELRNINGEPIYIYPHGWRICYGIDAAELHDGVEKVNLGNSCYLSLNGYGTLWTPYRQNPNHEKIAPSISSVE